MSDKRFYDKDFKFGILGGGQLGRMLIQEAINFDIKVHILDPSANAPCSKIAHDFTQGDFNDFEAVKAFGEDKDVLTIEIENVNTEALEYLEGKGVKVNPSSTVIKTIKDKGLQKQFIENCGLATSKFRLISNKSEISADDLPFVLKLRTGGYDGRGVQVMRSAEDLESAFNEPCVVEDLVDIDKELSIIVSRNESGDMNTYPLVELVFNPEANLVDYLMSPAKVSNEVEELAKKMAQVVVEKMNFVGILAIELFLDKSGNLLINEMAPRTHNSGHHTIEANVTSQFEQHMRAVVNLPLGSTEIRSHAAMLNLLGEDGFTGPVKYEGLEEIVKVAGIHPHIYGKSDTKPFRKMGHVTVLGQNYDDLMAKVAMVKKTVKVKA